MPRNMARKAMKMVLLMESPLLDGDLHLPIDLEQMAVLCRSKPLMANFMPKLQSELGIVGVGGWFNETWFREAFCFHGT